ncbi:MAG: EAL domain-containing protein [Spirochaetales bacterium]|nr:EAL domain-containing protein [Spirochaetales bacterium]
MNFTDLNILSLYQPLYSVQERKYIALEALSRGRMNDKDLSAAELFDLPVSNQEILTLNKECIRQALRSSASRFSTDQLSLFLNFDSSLLDSFSEMADEIYSIVRELNLDPDRIVIELIEKKVHRFDVLMRFVRKCRELGFLIALDDVGSGYSNFERIVQIKPDIIKIDRNLVKDISEEFYKREVCRSLINLSHSIGALSLAEGVETLEEALVCQNLGVDILQGFYFSKPKETFHQIDISSPKVSLLVEAWTYSLAERAKEISDNIFIVKKQANSISQRIFKSDRDKWDQILNRELNNVSNIECAYILNAQGKQITGTVLKPRMWTKKHFLFKPARMGTDHSQKAYFLNRSGKQKWYISDRYISRATGNLCRTVSLLFKDKKEKNHYLCLDIKD